MITFLSIVAGSISFFFMLRVVMAHSTRESTYSFKICVGFAVIVTYLELFRFALELLHDLIQRII